MNNIEREKYINQNYYLRSYSERILFESKDIIDRYRHGEKIDIDSSSVPIELLIRIMEDDEFLKMVTNILKNSPFFIIGTPQGEEITNHLSFRRNTILKGIELLISKGIIPDNSNSRGKINSLQHPLIPSIEELRERYKGNVMFEAEGIDYSIPYEYIISYIEKQRNGILENDDSIFHGIPKHIFLSIKDDFVKQIEPRTLTTFFEDVVSNELRNAVIDGMPEEYTTLEKAIYIYIKLCKLLTYDEEFYVFKDYKQYTEKHGKIDSIRKITPDNNGVTCFKFNIIYAALLSEFGVSLENFTINALANHMQNQKHMPFSFRINRFSLEENAIDVFSHSDLMNAKVNGKLDGLKCTSASYETIDKFRETFNSVYGFIQKQEKEKKKNIHTLDELLNRYQELTTNLNSTSFSQRASILVDVVNKTGMVGIDAYVQLKRLGNCIFSWKEKSKHIEYTIARTLDTGDDKLGKPIVIIAVHPRNIRRNDMKTEYYQFIPGQSLTQIPRELLQSMCLDGTISFLSENHKIPGIEMHSLYEERVIIK